MGIAIFLRTQQMPNNFRNTILSIIKDVDIDYVIMTYPYFYEEKPYTDNGIKKYGQYSILNDNLRDSILKRNKFKIVTISSDSNSEWKESYEKFVKKLKDDINASNNNIEYRAFFSGTQFAKLHAKIMIGCKRNGKSCKPVILMLGSSNLTNNAFGKFKYYNYESDIVLWNDKEYTFSFEELEAGDLEPILCNPEKEGIEQQYIDYFWSIFKEDYNKERLEEVIR